jgi:uncharacterized protein (DUF697 family)
MATPLTLARAWRILKEVDLEAIRQAAETPLRVRLLAESTADADDLALLLIAGHPPAADWLDTMDVAMAIEYEQVARASSGRALVDPPDLLLVVSRVPASPSLDAALRPWRDRKTRMVNVNLASTEPHGRVTRQGRWARVAVDRLEPAAADPISEAILSVVDDDERLALGRQFPMLRACLFDQLTGETARANAGYAFSSGLAEAVPLLTVPLNIGDTVVLTKNQLVMAYRLALAAGKQGSPRHLLTEILGVLGGGLLFRQLARQLVGLIPVLGIVPKVAVAYGGTWAIGRAVALWAEKGETLTRARMRQLLDEGMSRGRSVAASLKRTEKSGGPQKSV